MKKNFRNEFVAKSYHNDYVVEYDAVCKECRSKERIAKRDANPPWLRGGIRKEATDGEARIEI